MTINHSKCEHASTSSARAKCRRGQSGGATPKVVDMRNGAPTGKASTPRDRDKQCDICGVERISMRGTPLVEGYMIFVGDKCAYYLNGATDVKVLD